MMNLVVDNSLDHFSAEDLARFVYLLRKRASHEADSTKASADLEQAKVYYEEFLKRK